MSMKSSFILLAWIPFVVSADSPKANPDSCVILGKTRFTVLTDRMIRMEYAPDGVFEDRATFTFVNRDLPKVEFVVEKKGEGCTIDTGAVKLEYAGGDFTSKTLSAHGKEFAWTYGDADKGNLYGTKRTLDAVKDRATLMSGIDNNWGRGGMEKGILSRDGWTIVDDSKTFLFVPTDDHWQNWSAPRTPLEGRKDLYLFAYGHDYKGCLKDYTRVAGKIPLPPKWAFGYWWSRYWLYSDAEVRELATRMREVGVPQDVFILDMEWHETWGIGPAGFDEFGERIGWTGYTWNKHLFPDPKKLMEWFHAHGLKTAANLHPASGVTTLEACYPAFCADYGWAGTNSVPYRMSERKWADSYFKTVLGPIEDEGMDFWWLDWQQWPTSKYVPGLNNTFWLNYVFNRHMEMKRNGAERPIIYHRWGGLGSHRYQVGFSGDTMVSWKVLELMPWFTATAANVGYGYWGHDIGGHYAPDRNGLGLDGDLYLRWLQSGVFTPIFKTHSTKDANIERRVWKYPNEMFTLREAIRLRYRLAPYIYTAARMAYDKGVSICRPMYYDWPEEDAAYDQHLHELMFGNDILAGTVVRPMDKATRLSPCEFWFPEGRWFDVETGSFIEGGKTLELKRAAAENPWFVKAGAILPMYPDNVMSLQQADDSKMVLFVTPGADEGTGDLYEDAGTNPDYADTCAWTCFHQRMVGNTLHLGIGARDGTYLGMPASRSWEIRLPNRLPGATAKVNGRIVPTTYIGKDLTLVVTTPALNPNEAAHVEITWPSRADEPLLAGKRGFLHRAAEVGEALKPAYRAIHWTANVPNSYLKLAQLGSMIECAPERTHELLKGFDAARAKFGAEFTSVEPKLGSAVSSLVRAQLGF